MNFSYLKIWLAQKILAKLRREYAQEYKQKLSIILVTGTAGKSSTVSALRDLFLQNSWHVFTGAGEKKSLNSLTGLSMCLMGRFFDFEGQNGKKEKLNFLAAGLNFLSMGKFSLREKTVLIYECGFDHEGESGEFAQVFGGEEVDLLIVTNLTAEHTMGFSQVLNLPILEKIYPKIPQLWQQKMETEGGENLLKNIALEQFRLLENSNYYILPTCLGQIDNQLIDNLNGQIAVSEADASRNGPFQLQSGDYLFASKYLFPLTLAKLALTLEKVAQKFNLPLSSVQPTLDKMELPAGRFGVLAGKNQTTMVDSSYNSDPASLQGFLDLFKEISRQNGASQHYLILGEMRELGQEAKQAHEQILEELASLQKEFEPKIFLLGKEWEKCQNLAVLSQNSEQDLNTEKPEEKPQILFEKAGQILAKIQEEELKEHSWLWFKGSQNTVFLEIILQELLQNPKDAQLLCRRGQSWDQIREAWR